MRMLSAAAVEACDQDLRKSSSTGPEGKGASVCSSLSLPKPCLQKQVGPHPQGSSSPVGRTRPGPWERGLSPDTAKGPAGVTDVSAKGEAVLPVLPVPVLM